MVKLERSVHNLAVDPKLILDCKIGLDHMIDSMQGFKKSLESLKAPNLVHYHLITYFSESFLTIFNTSIAK